MKDISLKNGKYLVLKRRVQQALKCQSQIHNFTFSSENYVFLSALMGFMMQNNTDSKLRTSKA